MKENNQSCFQYGRYFKMLWSMCCVIATIFTVAMQISNYLNGHDATVVEYKKFNNEEIDVYPSIGICFSLALDEEKLKSYGLNRTIYSEFLSGNLNRTKNTNVEELLKLDYDEISIDLEDIIIRYAVITNIWEQIILYDALNVTNKITLESAPGFKEHSMFAIKCFSIDIPFIKGEKLIKAFIEINSTIFPSGIRPANANDPLREDMFIVAPHYPKQFYRKLNVGQQNWPIRTQNSSKRYNMEFNVRNVEIQEHRNKYQEPCSEGLSDFDDEITNWIMNKIGCKPPYWKYLKSALPPCSTFLQLQNTGHLVLAAVFGALEMAQYNGEYPCRSLEKIQYDVHDIDFPNEKDDSKISLVFNFKEFTYKEVKSVRSMDLQALIGTLLSLKCSNFITFIEYF